MWLAVSAAAIVIFLAGLGAQSWIVGIVGAVVVVVAPMIFFAIRQWWMERRRYANNENGEINANSLSEAEAWNKRIRNEG